MGNLFSLTPHQATPEAENTYNNIISYLNNLDDSNNTLIDTLKRLRDESYKNEIIFFKSFIPFVLIGVLSYLLVDNAITTISNTFYRFLLRGLCFTLLFALLTYFSLNEADKQVIRNFKR